MPPAEALVVAVALAVGAAALVVALRLRAQMRADRLAFAAARQRAATFAEGTRRVAAAGRRSVDDVRGEIVRALVALAPDVDSVPLFDERDGVLVCTVAHGARVAYFSGTEIARTDTGALPARALAYGHRVTLGEPDVRAFHPNDAFAVAVPLTCDDGRRVPCTLRRPPCKTTPSSTPSSHSRNMRRSPTRSRTTVKPTGGAPSTTR